MSIKGLDFDTIAPRSLAGERRAQWVAENNKRWAIVGQCMECGRDLVAEEVVPHRLNHVPDRLRSLARDVAALPIETRLELFGLFTRSGKLKDAE
jgi:hypothetical protein